MKVWTGQLRRKKKRKNNWGFMRQKKTGREGAQGVKKDTWRFCRVPYGEEGGTKFHQGEEQGNKRGGKKNTDPHWGSLRICTTWKCKKK